MHRKLAALGLAVLPLSLASPARADSVKEMLEKLPAPSLESAKSLDALEYCISVGSSEWFSPIAIRGEGKRLIYGNMNASFMSAAGFLVSIEDKGDRRVIAVKVYKGYDRRMDTLLRGCV